MAKQLTINFDDDTIEEFEREIREIWEQLYNTDNDVMATKYFLDMLSAVDIIKRKSNLDKMTAKEFLDGIHKLASSSSEDYSKGLEDIIKAWVIYSMLRRR